MTPQYGAAVVDVRDGVAAWDMWGRLGWQEIKRRYRRTAIGPLWTTLSLGVFIAALGLVWARLWKQDPRSYLPFLCAGMLPWTLVSTIVTDGCTSFIAGEGLIKQLRVSYTILSCSVVWRNMILFVHNLGIFVLVAVYGGVPLTPATLLAVPGLVLIGINGLWVSTLAGLLCTRFRDLQQVIGSLLQVALFVTPIFWQPDQLGPRARPFVDFNLLFHFVDIVRSPLLGRAPAPWSWTVTLGTTLVGSGVGLWMFARYRRRIPYWL